jgi:hypothetical protein
VSAPSPLTHAPAAAATRSPGAVSLNVNVLASGHPLPRLPPQSSPPSRLNAHTSGTPPPAAASGRLAAFGAWSAGLCLSCIPSALPGSVQPSDRYPRSRVSDGRLACPVFALGLWAARGCSPMSVRTRDQRVIDHCLSTSRHCVCGFQSRASNLSDATPPTFLGYQRSLIDGVRAPAGFDAPTAR